MADSSEERISEQEGGPEKAAQDAAQGDEKDEHVCLLRVAE